MISLDDEGDFAWQCAWCRRGLNVRWLADMRHTEIFNVMTGQDLFRNRTEYVFCSHACREVYWRGL